MGGRKGEKGNRRKPTAGHSWGRRPGNAEEMKKSKKQLIIKIVLGIAGLVAVYFLGRGISHLMYGGSGDPEDQQAQTDESLPPPKAALTEEELEEFFRSAKESATASAAEKEEAESKSEESKADEESGTAEPTGEEEGGEETPETGVIDFDYLKTLNKDIYAWITVPGTVLDYPILQHPTDDSY